MAPTSGMTQHADYACARARRHAHTHARAKSTDAGMPQSRTQKHPHVTHLHACACACMNASAYANAACMRICMRACVHACRALNPPNPSPKPPKPPNLGAITLQNHPQKSLEKIHSTWPVFVSSVFSGISFIGVSPSCTFAGCKRANWHEGSWSKTRPLDKEVAINNY